MEHDDIYTSCSSGDKAWSPSYDERREERGKENEGRRKKGGEGREGGEWEEEGKREERGREGSVGRRVCGGGSSICMHILYHSNGSVSFHFFVTHAHAHTACISF